MTERLRHFLRGAGSVLDIAPPPDPRRYLPQGSDAERLLGDVERIGADMRHVMELEANERSNDGRSGTQNKR
jgi:hypothetical protein